MSDASIIREFLVALGVKVDDPGIKKFSDGIEKATKIAGALATGVEAMAIAVEAAVAKVSDKFEDLYYASQRIGASVEDIQAFGFAIGQMGGSAQGARQSLENMAEFLRSNPGGAGFVEGLGVQLKYVNGQAQLGNDAMDQLAARFRSMPYYQAKITAGMLGIDPRTLQAMLRGPDEAEKRYHDMAQRMGVDQQAAAKASHDFMNDLRELLAMVTLVADKIVLAVQPMADRVIRYLEQLNDETGGWAVGLIALGAVLGPILALVDPLVIAVGALAGGMAALWSDFEKWRSGGDSVIDWSKWADQIDAITAALQPLADALARLGGDLAHLAGLIAKAYGPAFEDLGHLILTVLVSALHLVTDALNVIADVLEGRWQKAWADARKFATDAIGGIVATLKSATKAVEDFFYPMFHHGQAPPQAAARPTGTSAQARAAAQAAAATHANENTPAARAGQAVSAAAKAAGDHISAFFQRNGFSAAQAAGISAGAYAESGFNPDATNPKSGAFGIGQWLGSRKADLFRMFGPHPSLDQQLQFMLWEMTHREGHAGSMLKSAGNAAEAMEAYVRRFMRPGAGLETAGDLARGSAYLSAQLDRPALAPAGGQTVNVSQKTDIHFHEVHDARQAAQQAQASQGRTNAQLVRNLKTAVS